MNTDKHGWGKLKEWLGKVEIGKPGWRFWTWRRHFREVAGMVQVWKRTCDETERKWEKLYEEACEGRDRMRERADQWETVANEQKEARKRLEQELLEQRQQRLAADREATIWMQRCEKLENGENPNKQTTKTFFPWNLDELAAQLENENAELRAGLEQAWAYHRRPSIVMDSKPELERRNLERLLVLAGLDEKNPLWQVVLSYADEHEQTERAASLAPGLVNDVRQYNVGRAASAYDFALALRDLYREAQIQGKSKG